MKARILGYSIIVALTCGLIIVISQVSLAQVRKCLLADQIAFSSTEGVRSLLTEEVGVGVVHSAMHRGKAALIDAVRDECTEE